MTGKVRDLNDPQGVDPATPAERLARARSDPQAAASEVLLKVLLGQVNERTAMAQRQAALDILGGAMWEHFTDAQLNAHLDRVVEEIKRRKAAKP